MTGGDSEPDKTDQAEVKHLQPSARPSVPGGRIAAADARGPGFLEEEASQIEASLLGPAGCRIFSMLLRISGGAG